MQAADFLSARIGFDHGFAGVGGWKRTGGVSAKGMPRNWSTEAVALGNVVVVPITAPEASVTVGFAVANVVDVESMTVKSFFSSILM